ncbi:hypothetical protein [Flavobacterium hibisci]|uniref:hypothetical protein n=1 Tax=Flavobacterium hibisci TaxID=1914462 RepID=UPI001CC04D49|nr:hypothetical protein [Flavobacterium hibisci]MBZ4040833.1 hypothetical protein [Flavobacterium hibisci]
MKIQFNSKLILIAVFTGLFFSCKNNISGGVGSDGKNLDSITTNPDSTKVLKDTSDKLKK